MEAVVVTALPAAAATKEVAWSASVVAAAAEEDAAADAAALNAKEAAAVAATAREGASATALNAKEAAAVAATGREAAAAAAMQASKKRKFNLIDHDQDPPGSGDVDDRGSVDLTSRLPDAILGSIVSLLPTQEGARTQVISRRWRPLWRSAPLSLVDLELGSKGHTAVDLIPKILSEHLGPGRRFALNLWTCNEYFDKIAGWLSSQALDNLEELELTFWFRNKLYQLPSSVYRFAPTLCVAKFGGCHFPNLMSLEFPCLKQLTLDNVTISEGALQSMLSSCPALESLELMDNSSIGCLCISSQTLKSLGFSADSRNGGVFLQELVIQNAPCLERLLPLDPRYGPATIRIISAPKLKILGMLSEDILELHFGTTVFQKMLAVGLTTKMQTMRVLVLDSAGPNLDAVVNFLKRFPCLERLYVIFQSPSRPWIVMDNLRKYDPLDPIECLELHLKIVMLKNYDGTSSSIDFAKFFVLNAKVLKEMKITLPYHREQKWFANQRSRLPIRNRASKDARIELRCGTKDYFTDNKHTHDLSMADPFDIPSKGCYKCSCGPF
ncbi:unnamed protein product [Alopecurus aequalis]